MPHEPLLAGRVLAHEVLARLAKRRPLFHSEADLQHAFARALWEMDDELDVRLEARQPGPRAEYLDLYVLGPTARTAVEFKYFTRGWAGTTGPEQELYDLRSHAATDLARLGYIRDIERLERFGATSHHNGLAIMLTNESGLWLPPQRSRTRDAQFRIHEGRTLSGSLVWGHGDYPANNHSLTGTYTCHWRHYADLPDGTGSLQYLLIETHATAQPAAR